MAYSAAATQCAFSVPNVPQVHSGGARIRAPLASPAHGDGSSVQFGSLLTGGPVNGAKSFFTGYGTSDGGEVVYNERRSHVMHAGRGRGGYGGRGRGRGRMDNRDQGPKVPINNQIREREVRLLGNDRELIGMMSSSEALDLAMEQGLDLVLIAGDAKPPVCRIMDYNKFKFDQDKKAKETAKKQKTLQVNEKELKMRYNIDVADYNVRKKAALKFLGNGDRVKVICQFRGREQDYQDLAIEMFKKLAGECSEVGKVEGRPGGNVTGRSLIMVLAPLVTKAKVAADRKSKAKKAGGATAVEDDEDVEDDEEFADDDDDVEETADEELETARN